MNSRWIFRFFGLIYMIAPLVAEAETEPVSVVLSQSADQIATGKTSIIVTIRNDGDQAVTISKFQLPFDWHGPLPNRQFDVIDFQGQKQEYSGSWDKVVGRPASSFVHLGAHQTLTGTVELRYSYRFDTQVSNHFTVQYSLPLGIVEEGTEPDENSPSYSVDPNRIRVITSNVLPLNIDATSPLDPAVASAEPSAFVPASLLEFRQLAAGEINDPNHTCNVPQTAAIIAAFSDAKSVINNSLGYVNSMFGTTGFDATKPASVSYVKWFGEYDGDGKMPGEGGNYYAGRAGVVVATMRSALYASSTHTGGQSYVPLTECQCPAGTLPEVAAKARGNYQILLCEAFFNLKATGGDDSRALTLYHELTHFKSAIADGRGGTTQVRQTWDYGYGASFDQSLAKTQPAQAVNNADSYEKFGLDVMRYYGVSGW
ncbi:MULTISPECIES: M35 family metallo-endopeptidase [Luteibacter]|uniref:M35 family metallo-endopeptidase n=1 Tax=Luteibacter TaxID=242605 RepID=UPI00055C205D|nr:MULTISPECIES: M35 family metallo-endopeptidase [unclassified Luteibacter]